MTREGTYISLIQKGNHWNAAPSDDLEEAWLDQYGNKVLAVLKITGDTVELVPKPEPDYWILYDGNMAYWTDGFGWDDDLSEYTVYREDEDGNLIRLFDSERDEWVAARREGK